MKKIFLLIISLALLAVQGWASPVDQSAATSIAQDFIIHEMGHSHSSPLPKGVSLRLVHAEVSSVDVSQNAYYIFNTGSGFVIVSGDNRTVPILGYGDEEFDMDDMPCGLQYLLNIYKEHIDQLLENPDMTLSPTKATTGTDVGPLLKTKWDQRKPFNNNCPLYNGNKRCVTGCVCTALSQIMFYWTYPASSIAVPGYTTDTYHFSMPELPATTFDWKNMKENYSSYNTTQANAVATLMQYVGQAMRMDYGPDGSGAAMCYAAHAAVLFGYDKNILNQISISSDTEWTEKMLTELRAGRPIFYAGGYPGGSHAYVVDGYKASTDKYHVNFGWGGSCDGYYSFNHFLDYNSDREMYVGLKPGKPEIDVSEEQLSFNNIIGETETKTFVVTGYALNGDLSIKLNNGGTIYSLNKTSISRKDATLAALADFYGKQYKDAATVTVTYKPTSGGTSNASITISGGGATPKTISLSGTAYTPQITVDPASLSFNASTGETKTDYINVYGSHLTGDLTLTLNDKSGNFCINTFTITKESDNSAFSGVKVTYRALTAGTSKASITISGGGDTPKTISLSGTAIDPQLTVEPDTLRFSCYVGESNRQTLFVNGSNLYDSVYLKLHDTKSIYSLNKTRLTHEDVMNGSYNFVHVTFRPTEVGTFYSYVDVSSNFAEHKWVVLIGEAYMPEITVEPESLTFTTVNMETQNVAFFVKGKHLKNGLNVTLSDDDENYSINKNKINIFEALEGAWVTVTYRPKDLGLSHASITISGGGAEPKTVNIDGINLAADAKSISFDTTYSGYQSSQTITLTCPGLTKDLQLSVPNVYPSFGASKQTITPEEAAAGAEVNVFFSPTKSGRIHGVLNVNHEGFKSLEIPLSGMGIKSDGYITASTTTLSLDTQAGEPMSKTFEVTFSYPNGTMMMSPRRGVDENNDAIDETAVSTLIASRNIKPQSTIAHFDSLTFIATPGPVELARPDEPMSSKLVLELSGATCFSVTPSVIELNTVPCTVTVTVTYLPCCEGTNDATLTIGLERGAAKPFVMQLTGTATEAGQIYAIHSNNDKEASLENGLCISPSVYAKEHAIIIESPINQSAIISDIAGCVTTVNLEAGLNVIPVNSMGIYIVRIQDKTVKLLLR